MPPDLPIEQELILKKRARRRLVGAIALVLLMVIVLPQILQDRAVLAEQEPIKITMPVVANISPESVVKNPVANMTDNSLSSQQQLEPAFPDSMPAVVLEKAPENVSENKTFVKESLTIKDTSHKNTPPTPIAAADKKVEATNQFEIVAPAQPRESFTVQVGVYSDAANVKRLQEQLKQAGFTTHTEKVKTPKGESLKLKTGNFNSRQDASVALAKIKESGLPGIVIANE